MDSFTCGKSGSTDQFPGQNPKSHLHEAAALFSLGSSARQPFCFSSDLIMAIS